MISWPLGQIWVQQILNGTFFGALPQHIRLVWSYHGYFGLNKSHQNMNHSFTKSPDMPPKCTKKVMITCRHEYYYPLVLFLVSL